MQITVRVAHPARAPLHGRKLDPRNEFRLQHEIVSSQQQISQRPSKFIIMIVANNLYDGVMEKFCLPLNGFDYFDQVWDSDIELELINKILETENYSDFGYIV